MRVLRNDYTAYFEAHPEELQPFPVQLTRSVDDGAMHLGGQADHLGGSVIDPRLECYPAGQGAGAIDELVPAAELVRRFVAEASEALARIGGLTVEVGKGVP
jgi:NAD(P)H-dependent flavin oxidoreductase YrpB (nitropropane dioxygenase family)